MIYFIQMCRKLFVISIILGCCIDAHATVAEVPFLGRGGCP